MTALPEAQVAHKVEGRLRVKIPCKRYDDNFFDSLGRLVSRRFPELRVEVNPVTASALFLGPRPPKEIMKYALKSRLFRVHMPARHTETVLGAVRRSFKDLDHSLLKYTGGELDVASVIFLSLVGNGLYQIALGNFSAPSWYTAFWYALGVFSKSSLLDASIVEMDDE